MGTFVLPIEFQPFRNSRNIGIINRFALGLVGLLFQANHPVDRFIRCSGYWKCQFAISNRKLYMRSCTVKTARQFDVSSFSSSALLTKCARNQTELGSCNIFVDVTTPMKQ